MQMIASEEYLKDFKQLRELPSRRSPRDANPAHATFRAELDCTCEEVECTEPIINKGPEEGDTRWVAEESMTLWGYGKIDRLTAWEAGPGNVNLIQSLGVAPVLLLRVQLGASVTFLVLGALSVVAILENISAWDSSDHSGHAVYEVTGNTTQFYLMTTLGWRLASVAPSTARVQNWIVMCQFFVVLVFSRPPQRPPALLSARTPCRVLVASVGLPPLGSV